MEEITSPLPPRAKAKCQVQKILISAENSNSKLPTNKVCIRTGASIPGKTKTAFYFSPEHYEVPRHNTTRLKGQQKDKPSKHPSHTGTDLSGAKTTQGRQQGAPRTGANQYSNPVSLDQSGVFPGILAGQDKHYMLLHMSQEPQHVLK